MANKLELTWVGKENEIKVEPRILIENPALSNMSHKTAGQASLFDAENADNFDNMLIHGDNLLALKALESRFAGQVKCIYIDPPYNTGSAFEHYDDNLEHSTWLSLMRPRLKLFQHLLSDDGVILISIDDDECAYLKVLCDEIFERHNFQNMLTIETGEVFGKKAAHIKKSFVKVKDYILVYSKDSNKLKDITPLWTATNEVFDPHYSIYIDESMKKSSLIGILKEKQWIVDIFNTYQIPIRLENVSKVMELDTKFKKYVYDELSNNIYQDQPYTKNISENLANVMKEGEIHNIDGILVFKTKSGSFRYYQAFSNALHCTDDYKSECTRSTARGDLWKNYHIDMRNVDDEGDVKFKSSKKPERLIRDLLKAYTKTNDLILDSFLGSGTTAAVAQKMGRRWIGIEMGDHAYTHCKVRLDKVIDGSDQGGITKSVNWKGGGGYRFYELAPTLVVTDKFGNPVINKEYNADMLAAAMALQEGFTYCPDDTFYWKQGKNENAYIFTTTSHVTADYLASIHSEMQDDEYLVIACKTYDSGIEKLFKNITVKKIPQVLLGRCEFGKNDYSLNIVNMPIVEEEDE